MKNKYYVHHWQQKELPKKLQKTLPISLSAEDIIELSEDYDIMISDTGTVTADRTLYINDRGLGFTEWFPE